MHSTLTWISIALAALFVVAIAVAAWEHYATLAGSLQAWPEMPPSDHVPLAPLPVKVDLNIDELSHKPVPRSDSADRRAALAGVLDKLAHATPINPTRCWAETQPMEATARAQRV